MTTLEWKIQKLINLCCNLLSLFFQSLYKKKRYVPPNDKFNIWIIDAYVICINSYKNCTLEILILKNTKSFDCKIFISVWDWIIIEPNLGKQKAQVSQLVYQHLDDGNSRPNVIDIIYKNKWVLNVLRLKYGMAKAKLQIKIMAFWILYKLMDLHDLRLIKRDTHKLMSEE